MGSSKEDLGTKQSKMTVTVRRWTSLSRATSAKLRPDRHATSTKGFSFPRRRRRPGLGRSLTEKTAVPADDDALADLVDLDWYAPWIASQRSKLPVAVNALLAHGRSVALDDSFRAVSDAVQEYIRTTRDTSIDEIIDHLEMAGVLDRAKGDDADADAKRLLVFALLGWQSMIYLPELNSHPLGSLAVQHDVDEPDSGLVFDRYVTSTDMCDRPLWVLLKCFGNLLPARPIHLTAEAAVESSKTAASWTALYPDQLNAHLLHTLLRVRFRWVDTLALHLDYDKATRTLSLFSFPSMCVAQLRARGAGGGGGGLGEDNMDGDGGRAALFAFSSLEVDAADPRADEDDIAHFLEEVLVSFRLLFGQSAKSRRLFRAVYSQQDAPFRQPDTLLARLCSEKHVAPAGGSRPRCIPPDRRIYYTARDFPVLYRKVELLADELKSSRPTSVRDLLNDRRDTLQFWTFWLISVFGGLSILMGLIQIVLQGIQIAQAAGKL